jgi:hypothetical protein
MIHLVPHGLPVEQRYQFPRIPFSEGRLAAHVPHYEAREAPLDDVLSEQRKPHHILRARGHRTTSSAQPCL